LDDGFKKPVGVTTRSWWQNLSDSCFVLANLMPSADVSVQPALFRRPWVRRKRDGGKAPGGNAREQRARRPVSRVLSAHSFDGVDGLHGTTIPLGRTSRRASRDQPGWRDGNVPEIPPDEPGEGSATPIRSCSRWGLPCRPRYRRRGALLPHRFTLAHEMLASRGRFVFCGTIPGVAPAGR